MTVTNRLVTITRLPDQSKSTLGYLSVTKADGFAWVCKTLELPNKGNAQKISCIPTGEYDVEWTRSPLFSEKSLRKWLKENHGKTEADCPDDKKNIYTYAVKNVPNRAGIRMHSANFTRQLLGCIALGNQHKDIDIDGTTDVIHSGATMKEFETLMEHKPFKLRIQ